MTMWNWMTPATLIDMQRKAALGYMGEQARVLLRDGYPCEADQILDAMSERQASWKTPPEGSPSE